MSESQRVTNELRMRSLGLVTIKESRIFKTQQKRKTEKYQNENHQLNS